MADFTLQDVIKTLDQGWKKYPSQYQELSPEAQEKFLHVQGFESFHDLLAHIVGWWEEGLHIITGILDVPSFTYEDRDVDVFNLELVKKFSAWSDEDLLQHYENVREAFLDLVLELNEDALTNKDIHSWLKADVIEHLEDHKIV